MCQIERLGYGYPPQWEWQGNVILTNGTGFFNSTLYGGLFGYFRCKSTNNYYLSTNAFGAISDNLWPGYSFIGNPFSATSITNIMPTAATNTLVSRYNPATTNYSSAKYAAGRWLAAFTVNQLDGFLVNNPSSNSFRFVVSGLYTTNTITKAIPAGLSMQVSPLYKMIDSCFYRVDLLTNGLLGGYSALPVRSIGFTNECNLLFLINSTTCEYQSYSLSNSTWNTYGLSTSVPLNLVEGFWIDKPTNATWNVNMPIW